MTAGEKQPCSEWERCGHRCAARRHTAQAKGEATEKHSLDSGAGLCGSKQQCGGQAAGSSSSNAPTSHSSLHLWHGYHHPAAYDSPAFLGSLTLTLSKSISTDSSFKCFFSFPISNLGPYCFKPDQATVTKMVFLAFPSPETLLNISNHLECY